MPRGTSIWKSDREEWAESPREETGLTSRAAAASGRSGALAPADPVRLEIFRNLFVSVCEEMGIALMRTGHSPNIKERRDYSCAVFDSSGLTIAQGDHMPVHLGSMPASVASALKAFAAGETGGLRAGDIVLLNDPFHGGTHLPDITLVSPLFAASRSAGSTHRPLFFLANRAHHSDVGGMAPGSMPLATEIYQEGLVLPPLRLVRNGRLDRDIFGIILSNCRTPEEREGDLRAQIAALQTGERRLKEMIERYGTREVVSYARHLQAYSRRVVTSVLRAIPDGTYRFEDRLDDDGAGCRAIPLRVALTIRRGRAIVDLRRSADQVSGGVNAVASITASAVYYVFRCLVSSLMPRDGSSAGVPWNAGSFEPIRILLRPGSILAARSPAAVAGGNVETSQRIVDLLLGALSKAIPSGVPAASQGTMNNLSFGGVDGVGKSFAYYETIGGGMGGRPAGAGLSGVHTHMTNSLNTPIEALEAAFPIRVERYGLRRRSGGAGKHKGGEGIAREIRFLVAARASILSERRVFAPWGRQGGRAGALGANFIIRADSARRRRLPGKVNLALAEGDRLLIETPGGGGWGRPVTARTSSRVRSVGSRRGGE